MENHTNRSLPVIGSIAVTALLVGGFVLWLQATTLDNLQQQIEGLRVSNEAATFPSEKTKSTVEVLSIDAHILAEVPAGFSVTTKDGMTYIYGGPALRRLGGEFPSPGIMLYGYENPKKLSLEAFAREKEGELSHSDEDPSFNKVMVANQDGTLIEGIEFQIMSMGNSRLLLFPVSETEVGVISLDVGPNGEKIESLEAIRETMRVVQ